MGLTNTQKIVLSLVIFLVLLIGWGMFPLFFKWVMVGIGSKENELKDFGSLGDIYGSLNTLFTSATLIIVMYSAYLQRQANNDARDAMAKQLQQASNATEKQLRQARLATKQQLALAQATHDAQIKESRYSVFSNMFYALMNQKHEILKNLCIRNGENFSSSELFTHMGDEFDTLVGTDFKDLNVNIIEHDIFMYNSFMKHAEKFINNHSFTNGFYAYFFVYQSLLRLIKESDLEDNDKSFFISIISNSLVHDEQVALLWVCCFTSDLRETFEDTGLIDTFLNVNHMKFIVKNFDKSIFSHEQVLEDWEKYTKKETLA